MGTNRKYTFCEPCVTGGLYVYFLQIRRSKTSLVALVWQKLRNVHVLFMLMPRDMQTMPKICPIRKLNTQRETRRWLMKFWCHFKLSISLISNSWRGFSYCTGFLACQICHWLGWGCRRKCVSTFRFGTSCQMFGPNSNQLHWQCNLCLWCIQNEGELMFPQHIFHSKSPTSFNSSSAGKRTKTM